MFTTKTIITWSIGLVFLVCAGVVGLRFMSSPVSQHILTPLGNPTPDSTPKPLLAFTFDNLSKREFKGSQIVIEKTLDQETKEYKAYLFSFKSDGKKVTGQLNIPTQPEIQPMPVIIMIRGYVDRDAYETGIGTKRAAEVFAQNGYLTLAPDFLGYGGSDMPENDVWWERFSNPVVVLNLIASIPTLSQGDPGKVGIWAHSNGGQIALSVLEISQKPIPTTLWAPVSKPFPYSVLYFTDEFDDEGKALRQEVARLEADYDARQYSITSYFARIKAPLQLHQGSEDKAVPMSWSTTLYQTLKNKDIEITYYTYPGADHNMAGSWETVVERDLKFFKDKLK